MRDCRTCCICKGLRVWQPSSCLAQRSSPLRPSRRMLLKDHSSVSMGWSFLDMQTFGCYLRFLKSESAFLTRPPSWCECILKVEKSTALEISCPVNSNQKGLPVQGTLDQDGDTTVWSSVSQKTVLYVQHAIARESNSTVFWTQNIRCTLKHFYHESLNFDINLSFHGENWTIMTLQVAVAEGIRFVCLFVLNLTLGTAIKSHLQSIKSCN